MKKLIIILFTLLVCISIQCQEVTEENNEVKLPPEVEETIYERIKEGYAPGFSIALIDTSGIAYFNFGKTAEDGKSVDDNTIYEIGSVTKVFTGILLAKQHLDGGLSLDDDINEYLPDDVKIPVMGDDAISFGNLSDHTSGLPAVPGNLSSSNPKNPYADYSVTQMYEFISAFQPVRSAGVEYVYSNLAQGLLGHLLALKSKLTYEELVIQTIATPLDMHDTRIDLSPGMKKNLAMGYSDGEPAQNWDLPTLAGAGALRSSAADMAKFIAANLGFVDSPLTEAMELSHQVRHAKAGDMRVGLGWHINKGDNGDIIWHNGGTGGYRAFAGFVKETGQGVVVLSNSSNNSDDIGFYLLDPGAELADLKFKSELIEVAESSLEQYVGLYELHPKFKITITKEGKQLFAQATGQDRFKIYPESDTLFFTTIVDAKISFQTRNGIVESLTLIQGERETLGKRIGN